MTKHINIAIATCALMAVMAMLHAGLNAQGSDAAKATADGVYTEAQAKRGATLYAEQCASCHGADLSGVADLFPALTGDTFVMTWQGKSVGELFERIHTTMPALDPGSLRPGQVADIIAHILSVSKYPAGATALADNATPLQQIKIDAPKK